MKLLNAKTYIRESNLIEGINDPKQDAQSLKAWEYLSGWDNVGEKQLLEVHKIITKGQLPRYESGYYRNVNVYVGNYTPPNARLAKHLIYNWVLDLHHDYNKLEPLLMHIRFEKIHPFIDGNGRTGRMFYWWHSLKKGKEPKLFTNDRKHIEYYTLFI